MVLYGPVSPTWLPDKLRAIGFWVQEKFNRDFQDGGHGGHLGFPIRNFGFFYLEVTWILPMKFRVSWMLPLYLHVNQKSDYDYDDDWSFL